MIRSTNHVEVSEKARRMAQRDRITWIVWEKDGVTYADRETAASLVLAMDANENGEFYGLEAVSGNGFIIRSETAKEMLNRCTLND